MSELAITVPFNWSPRPYQLPLWNYLHKDGKVIKKKRAACIWHRRAGKDLFGINVCAEQALIRPGLYWHLFPTYSQGRKIAWEGFTKEGRPFLDHFPPPLIEAKNDTEMRLKINTHRGYSVYQVVGTDSVDRLVGANPVGCIFSEYSLQDPAAWHLIQPILAENDGWAIFIYTPRGHNHGYDLLEMARDEKDWFAQVLSVTETKAVSEEKIQNARKSGMPEELIQQEFYCSFDAPLVGAYYSKQMSWLQAEGRICHVPWEPRLEVHTAWDLGMDDSMTIWFYQLDGYGQVRVIDYYENSGEGIAHYINHLKKQEYAYARHKAPHDIEVRELGTGKSRLEVARGLGIRFDVVKRQEVQDGIEAVRNLLPRCWFDKEKCKRGIEALKQYRKEFDEKRQVFREQPIHDWSSHGADSFRTLAVGTKDVRRDKKPPQEQALNDYSIFSI